MGAFNELIAESICPNCGQKALFEVQFKYGDAMMFRYKLGDTLKWGGNDIGKPGNRRVRVEGIGGPCAHCDCEYIEFDVLIEDDSITTLIPIGLTRENESELGYIVEQVT